MARFSVYRNPNAAGYLLNVQANILDHLNTRMVVPAISRVSTTGGGASLRFVGSIGWAAGFMASVCIESKERPLPRQSP